MTQQLIANSHLQVLQAVQDIGEAFATTLQLQPVLERIIFCAMQLAEGDAGSVMLLSEDSEWLVVKAAIGNYPEDIIGQRQAATESLAGQALARSQPILTKGRADGGSGPVSKHPRAINCSIVVGLTVAGRSRGVLSVNAYSRRDNLTEEQIALFKTLANMAAIMIEHARLYEDLEQKEQRLERFVDRFLRQAEQARRSVELSDSQVQLIAKAVRESSEQAPRPVVEEPSPLLQKLTQREQEVLAHIVQGLTNKEIASQLYLSPDTVKNHVVHIMEKLGAQDRTQAAVFAIRNGLVK